MTSCQRMKQNDAECFHIKLLVRSCKLVGQSDESEEAVSEVGRLLRPACVNAFHNDMVHFLGIGRWSGKKTCMKAGQTACFIFLDLLDPLCIDGFMAQLHWLNRSSWYSIS